MSGGGRLLLAAGLLLVACSSDDDADAADPFAPIEAGAPAAEGFAAAVAASTAGAGELAIEQEIVVAGDVLAESSGVVDLSAGTARLELAVQGPSGVSRIEQVFADGRLTERRLDRPGARAEEVDAGAGGPLLLPEADAVDDAAGVVDAVEAAVALAELYRSEAADAPPDATCWVGDVDGAVRQRIEVCVDDDDVLRRLRTFEQSSTGLVGTSTVVLAPPG